MQDKPYCKMCRKLLAKDKLTPKEFEQLRTCRCITGNNWNKYSQEETYNKKNV